MSEPVINILQSFMNCMYPGSIRTESIESLDNDYSNYGLEVENIDEKRNVVSKGQLYVTDEDLTYFRPGKFPTRWPICYIRRFGCSEACDIFSFESGRRCQTGSAIFAFKVSNAQELVDRLKRSINKQPAQESNNNQCQKSSKCTDSYIFCGFGSSHQGSSHSYVNDTRSPTRKKKDKETNEIPSLYDLTSDEEKNLANELTTYQSDINTSAKQLDPRPLSYVMLDLNMTHALNQTGR